MGEESACFVPLVPWQQYNLGAKVAAIDAFLAFAFVASLAYGFNDLVDGGSDKRHPSKKAAPSRAAISQYPSALPQ